MHQTIDGIDTHFIRQGQGRDILLLHGWGCDTTLFDGVTNALSQRMCVTVPDFPAHGQSGRPPASWGIAQYAAHILHLMDALGAENCDVIAHSFGARITIYLAARYPERFGKLVLTGAAGIKPEPSSDSAKRQSTFRRLRAAAQTLGKLPPLRALSEKAGEALVQRYGSADYKALDPQMREVFKRVIALDLRGDLPRIQSPTLLFWGDQDTQTPMWMAEVMQAEIPDAGLVIARGAGHYAYLEQAAFFLRVVTHFLLGEDA